MGKRFFKVCVMCDFKIRYLTAKCKAQGPADENTHVRSADSFKAGRYVTGKGHMPGYTHF